ncbi:MAG: hypothetical protein PHF31_05780 [Methylobacter sp.]|nr:hypothetical protein [Methylobacter sp.]
MRSLGYTITTEERHFLCRYDITKDSSEITVDADFDKDILSCLYVKKLKDANETKKALQSIHPNIKFWVIQVFKDKGEFIPKPTAEEKPPWL